MAINGGKIEFGVGFNVDKTGLHDIKNQLNEISKLSSTQIQSMNPKLNTNEAISAMQKVRIAIEEIKPALDKSFDTTTGVVNLQKLQTSLQKLNLSEIQNRFNAIGPQGQQAFLKISKAALTTNVTLKETSGFLDKMGTTFVNTIKWGVASSVMNNFTGAVQQAYGYVQHLDTSLNDIRIVTEKSAEEMDKFAVKANNAAKALGSSTTEYTEAALIYYQQGLSDQESQARAETTLKAANVTGQSAQAVSEQLTSVWNGYKVTAEETELYVDKLAAVAASTAADLEELSIGMSKVASAANNMGVDIDQLNAQLATIVSVTRQAPETAGTALKTIYARMEDLKIGGEDESGVKLGEVSSTLEAVGVSVMDTQGDLRDLGEVIEEVAGKWNTWTSAQQNAIAQALAGKRQYNNLLALFDNWDMYTDALETSKNATGTLQKQQDIYMESTEAHLQQLKTEWEDLYDSILDTKTINGVLDGLTAILDKVTTVIDAIGGGRTLITGLLAFVTTKFSKQVSSIFTPMIKNMQNAKANAEVLQGILKNIQVQQEQGVISGKAAEVMANTQKEMSQYWSIMSEEQINASQNTIREIGDWETKRENIERTKQSLQSYIGQLKNAATLQKSANSSDLLSNGSAANLTVTKFLESQSATAVEAQNNFSKLTKEAQRLNTTIKAAQGDSEKLGKINFTAFERSLQNVRDSVKELRTQANKGLIDKKVAEDAEEALKRIEKRFEAIKSQTSQGYTVTFNKGMLQSLTTVNGQLDKTNVKYQEYIKLLQDAGRTESQAAEELERLYNSLNKNDLALEKRAQSVSKLIGGLSSLIFTIQSISNIGNVITDENLTSTEKFSQIITSLAISLPMFITTVSNLKDGLVGLIGPTLLNVAAEQGLINADGVATATGAALIGVKEKEKITTDQLTAAMIRQKAVAILSNPIFLALSLAIAAVATAVMINKKRHEEEIEAIKKSNEAIREANNARNEEIDKNKELANSLQTLIEQYKEGTIAQEDYLSKKTEIMAQMDAEGRAALNVANNWMSATKAIDDYTARAAREKKENYRKNAETLTEDFFVSDAPFIQYDSQKRVIRSKDFALPSQDDEGVKAISQAMAEQGLNLSDITENGYLNVDLDEDMNTFLSFVTIIQDLAEQGVEIPVAWGASVASFVESDEYKNILTEQSSAFDEAVTEAGAMSNISIAQTLEEGEKAYQSFITKLTEEEGYTMDQAKEAWLKYISSIGTDVTNEMVQAQANIDTMMQSFSTFYGDKKPMEEAFEKLHQSLLKSGLTETDIAQGGITEQQWRDFYFGRLSIEDIARTIKDNLEKSFKQGFNDFKASSSEITDSMQSLITEAISGKVDTSENGVYQKLKQNIEDLIGYYPELTEQARIFNNEALIGTNQWTQAVYDLQAAFDALELDTLIDNYSSAMDKLENRVETYQKGTKTITTNERDQNGQLITETVPITFEADMDDFTADIEAIMDADYAINVEVHADIEDDFNNLVSSMENMDSMAEKIGEDFIVSAEDITEVAAAYPGILEGYTDLGNGTIQLNADIAQSAMDAASQAEIASTEELKQKIENTNAELQLKKNHYQAIIDIVSNASTTEEGLEKAVADVKSELDEIDQINSDKVANNETENAATVANDSQLQAGIVAQNWAEAYQSMAQSSYDAAEAAIQNAKAVADAKDTGDTSGLKKTTISANFTGESTSQTKVDTDLDLKNSSDVSDNQAYLDEIKNYAQQQINAIDAEMAANEALMVEATARLGDSVTTNSDVGKSSTDSSGSGSSSADEAETEEYLEREEDLYKQINEQLDEVESTLGRIQTIDEHSWGINSKKALEEENELLKEQMTLYEHKNEVQKSDLADRQAELSAQGITFSDDGSVMTNTEDVLNSLYEEYNAMVDTYNAMNASEQETYKETLEAKKDSIDEIEDAIDDYESAYNDYNDTLDDLLDTHYAIIENEVKQFTAEVEVHLELAEARNDWVDFWYDVVQDVEDTDFGKLIAKSMEKLDTYVGQEGTILSLTNEANIGLDEVQKQIANADNGGGDSIFGDDTELSKETLSTIRDNLIDAVTAAKEEIDNMSETYLDALDSIQDKLDEQAEGWENIGDHLNHNLEVLKLIDGEMAYDEINNQYQNILDNDEQLLEHRKNAATIWEQEIQKYQELIETTNEATNPELYRTYEQALEKATENYKDAVKDLDSSLESAIKNVQSKRDNLMEKTLDTLDKAISNGIGIDNIDAEWDLLIKDQDMYLDNVERAFNMDDINDAFDELLNTQDSSLSKQQDLLKFRDEELAKLNEKNKLTQYDIDELKARIEIRKQEIALEDAQRNKSNLRLRRDSQGNYTYQYTANEDEIDEAENGIMSAKKDWYELVKSRNKEVRDEIIQNIRDIYDVEKEYSKAIAEGDVATAQSLLRQKEMLLERQKALNAEAGKSTKDFYDGVVTYFEDVNNNTVLPMWQSDVSQMIDKWNNGGEDSFVGAVQAGITQLNSIQQEYLNNTEELFDAAGRSITDYRKDGVDPTTESLEDLQETNDDVNDSVQETIDLMDELGDALGEAEDAYNDLEASAVEAIEKINQTLKTLSETVVSTKKDMEDLSTASKQAATDVQNATNAKNGASSGNSNGTSGSSSSTTTTKTAKRSASLVDDPYGVANTYGLKDNSTGQYIVIIDAKSRAEAHEKLWSTYKDRYTGFKSGGYTGSWNNGSNENNGKLAFLHQKELVLNESDTSNILNAVNSVRDLVNKGNSSIDHALANSLANAMTIQTRMMAEVGSQMLQAIASSVVNNNQVQNYRNTTINADFSGVRSADAIYQALMNLDNYASQAAYSNAPDANRSY